MEIKSSPCCAPKGKGRLIEEERRQERGEEQGKQGKEIDGGSRDERNPVWSMDKQHSPSMRSY